MIRESRCRCLLCGMERHLTEQFSAPQGQIAYRQIVALSPPLSAFPAAPDLVSFLHTEEAVYSGASSKDRILAELLQGTFDVVRSSTSKELLLLAFVPMLHRISRQVLTRCPVLQPDDVTQHVVTAILESFDSPEIATRDTHLAFGIARLLRRNSFGWAERESRGAAVCFSEADTLERTAHSDSCQPMERAATLRHFLDRCHQRGVLSEEEVELLVQFRLGELPSNGYTNAARQRMKRLLGKLRRAANRPPQLRLF